MNIKKLVQYFQKFTDNPLAFIKLAHMRTTPPWIIPKDREVYRIGSWKYGKLRREYLNYVFSNIQNVSIIIEKVFNREIGMSLDPYEIVVLNSLIRYTNAQSVMEIGTFDGNTTLNLAANAPADAVIFTVDLPKDLEEKQKKYKLPKVYDNSFEKGIEVGVQYKGTKYEKKIRQIFSDSTILDFEKFNKQFDLMFIDGCHYYDFVKHDTYNALKYVKNGGLIVWHDYGMIPDVSKVVDETSKKIEVHAIRATRLAVGINKNPV